MTTAEQTFHKSTDKLKEAHLSKLFGHPCYKINKKAFCCLYKDHMVFKLEGVNHAKAIELKGAQLFDPSGKKRPMKEWVQLPESIAQQWPSLAKAAYEYVKKMSE